jgi:phosphoribosylformylglycinamidine cyclo-ligase
MEAHAAYSTLNMGSGLAVYCSSGRGEEVVSTAKGLGFEAIVAGVTEAGPRRIILEPVGVEFGGHELRLSPTG